MSRVWLVGSFWVVAAASLAVADDGPPARYRGVIPGHVQHPHHIEGRPGQVPVRLTWPGFQVLPNATRVFIQLTSSLEAKMTVQDRFVKVVFPNSRMPDRNSRRALDTRFFDTPVDRATLAKNKRAVTLRIELRKAATPILRSEAGPDGYHYVYVEFPKTQG